MTMPLSLTLNVMLLFCMWLEYASEVPGFSLPSSPATKAQNLSSAARSTPVSDREKAGLRGPVRTCIEDNDLPDGRKYLTAWEYSPEGRLLATRTTDPGGSEWLTSRTYDTDGRLSKVVSGKLGEPGSEMVYAYNEAGRLLRVTNGGGEGGRTDFHYDEQGHKTSIQNFDPKVLEGAQHSSFSGSPWDAAAASGIGVPLGGNITTVYDENDQPTEAQISALSNTMRTVLGGQAPAGTSFSYDTQGRVSKTRERNMVFEKTTTIIYNDHGDKAEERTTVSENSVIPTGIPHSIDERGVLVPSEPAVGPRASPVPEQSEVHYAYQYDSYGNWTQQTANDNSGSIALSSVRNRKLAYY